ncbi:hypothetical protein BDV19DRAFT_355595 [Aspergillus venezuelensis]
MVNMPNTDPFAYLNFDCTSRILSSLDTQNLVSCERVSKGWHTLVRGWISEWGWRRHFPHEQDYDLDQRSGDGIQRFKYLAGRECNLKHGRAGSVHMFLKVYHFLTIAGDYAVWLYGPQLHFQRLGVKEDGSLYDPQVLPLTVTRCWVLDTLLVNEEGYLVWQSMGDDPEIMECTLHVFSLPECREVLTINHVRKQVPGKEGSRPTRSAVAVGRRRIYAIDNIENSCCLLLAYDLFSGQQCYVRRVSDYIPDLLETGCSAFRVLRGGDPELLLWLLCPPQGSALTIINGERGDQLQAITGDFRTPPSPPLGESEFEHFEKTPTIHVHPRRKEFALSWQYWPLPSGLIQPQKFCAHVFSLSSDGMFHGGQPALLLPRGNCRSGGIAIDPFRSLAAVFALNSGIPHVQTLGPAPVEYLQEEDALLKGWSGEVYVPEQSHEITLPPLSRGQNRRQFEYPIPEPWGCVGHGIRFVDGDRVLFEVKSECSSHWHLFDFTPGIVQWDGLQGRIVSEEKKQRIRCCLP